MRLRGSSTEDDVGRRGYSASKDKRDVQSEYCGFTGSITETWGRSAGMRAEGASVLRVRARYTLGK